MSAAARAWWKTVITPQITTPTKALPQNPDDGSSSKALSYSLAKPTFYLGLGQAPNPGKLSPQMAAAGVTDSNDVITDSNRMRQLFTDRPADLDDSVTNIVAMAAHERTEGAIALTQNGAAGFKDIGDRMCWKIKVSSLASYMLQFCSGW
jgi:hypothetical protein